MTMDLTGVIAGASPFPSPPAEGQSVPLAELSALVPPQWRQEGGVFFRTIDNLTRNPFFSAGFGLYLLAFAGGAARTAASVVRSLIANFPAFQVQQMSVTTRNTTIFSNDESSHECMYAPCTSVRHWFWYRSRPLMLQRRRVETQAMGTDVLETMQLFTVGLSPRIMQEIVEDARLLTSLRNSDHTVLYQNAGGRWVRQEPRRRRPLHSVVLSGNTSEMLLNDAKLFLSSSRYYEDLGVPYRRGYLLHGPPGCGKSSVVMALAGELRLSICPLSLSSRGLGDDALVQLLNSAPLRSVVLLEDIDRAFSNDSQITMSGLLNALDGVAAQEGRIVFMTTNHVERLDEALIRPGRCDVKIEIGLLTREQAQRLFLKFFPHSSVELQEEFSRQISPQTLSVAQIQSHLFVHRDDADKAVRELPAFINSIRSFEVQLQRARDQGEKLVRLKRAALLHNAHDK
uniref:Putative ATP-dependent chaperone n=1 Tax=Trypanosoma vivax (strain Y486) TaxID=1055687 RepID=G0U0U1_TRYVY|nr:putative ATP-dependent chaperone, fragment [Trypanosoma vivax Y486]